MNAQTDRDDDRSFHHDWGGETDLTTTILDAVAEVAGEQAIAERPLSDVVDPDALEMLFESTGGSPRPAGKLTVPFATCLVTVLADGKIRITPDRA